MKLNLEEERKVYYYLIGHFEEGVAYISPLPEDFRGKKDSSSSFNIYKKNGRLLWKDFGGGGLSGDVYDLIQIMRKEINSFNDALEFYNKRVKNSFITTTQTMKKVFNGKGSSRKSKVNPKPIYHRNWKPFEINFWNLIGVLEPQLIRKRIYILEAIDWGNGIEICSKENEPCFIWDLSENGDMSSWKSYSPYSKNSKKKWRSWNLTDIPCEGLHLLKKGLITVFFNSGYKDGLVWENTINNPLIISLNPTAEGTWRKIIPIIPKINDCVLYKPTIIFDGDSAGIKAANEFSEFTAWNVEHLNYPKLNGNNNKLLDREYTKDITEILENYSYNKLNEIYSQIKIN